MTTIQLIACVGMIAGLFMVLGISPAEMSDSIFSRLTAAPGSIRADINETTKRKKAGFFRREITEAQAVLAASGREGKFPMVCMASLVLFALGACTAILAGNAFLVPVLAVGFMLLPFWYVKLTAGGFKKDVAAELETALSVITTAYLRTENFQQAVEENVRYLHHPVQEVFQRFLTRIKHIDPDREILIEYGDGLKECRKMLAMAKAGKRNGYLLEGMGCPGGCVAGAGTLRPVKESTASVERFKNAASSMSTTESPYLGRLKDVEEKC